MATPKYEKIDAADLDAYSDASGSDVAGEQDPSRSSTTHRRPKTSDDIRQHDRETIAAEEEAERLLAGDDRAGLSSIFRGNHQGQSRAWYKGRGAKRRPESEKVANGDVLHDVERGTGASIDNSRQSYEVDTQRLAEVQGRRRWRVLGWLRFCSLHVIILFAFILLLFGAFKASSRTSSTAPLDLARMMSNGSSMFLPTTILISLDGFRADFLDRGLTPTLNAFIRDGVSPKYMLPSFPSVTFANHFTLATGQFPESHGIVGNTFWDPELQRQFYYTDPTRSLQPEWWNAEPFWVTAEMQDVRTAIHMWPGSEAHLGPVDPAYVDKFNAFEHLDVKVDRILNWLDLPGPDDEGYNINEPRPQLIAAYVPDIDTDGHNFGPNSTEIRSTITRVDNMLADIFRGIDARNLTNIVNIIVVSDHGMATTDVTRLIQFEDLVDPALIEHIDGWPLYGLRPYDQDDTFLQKLHDDLVKKSHDAKYKDTFDVYLRDKTMPERYHFSDNQRIAPLWLVPKAGWAIVTEDEFNVESGLKNGDVYHPRGLHGYDFEHPLMRAIFVARGPAFPHAKGSQVEPFQNTEVYNIICDSLGIVPAGNNGTFHLPFKTSGKHDIGAVAAATSDVKTAAITSTLQSPSFSVIDPETVVPPTPTQGQSVIWTTDSHGSLVTVIVNGQGEGVNDHRPWEPVVPGDEPQDENLNNSQTWWDWLKGQVNDFKDWTGSVFHQGLDHIDAAEKEGWDIVYTNVTK